MIHFDNEYVTYDELTKAYHDCRKNKRRSQNSLDFEIDDAVLLYDLWVDLNSGKYDVGRSIAFCVNKPVKREVFAADFRDRIVHHLIINRIGDLVEADFIYDSYSCRRGKGTLFGVNRCAEQLYQASNGYTKETVIVKGDLKSFFMTIDKDILFDRLCQFIRKNSNKGSTWIEFTLDLIRKIIYNNPQDNCIRKQPPNAWIGLPKEKSLFHCKRNRGLPIGNLTSQIFANFYLSEFDKFVKEILGIKYYGRYVDDFYFFVDSISEVKGTLDKCREKLSEIGVILHPKKTYIQRFEKGLKFIGAVIKPNRIYAANRTKGNLWMKMNIYNKWLDGLGREPDIEEIEGYVNSINSYLGFLVHYRTYNIRRKILYIMLRNWDEYCYIGMGFRKLIIFNNYARKQKISNYWKREYELIQLIDTDSNPFWF